MANLNYYPSFIVPLSQALARVAPLIGVGKGGQRGKGAKGSVLYDDDDDDDVDEKGSSEMEAVYCTGD